MSPVEAPIITSMWAGPLVKGLISWHNMCAFANRIFISGWACNSSQSVTKCNIISEAIPSQALVTIDPAIDMPCLYSQTRKYLQRCDLATACLVDRVV